MRRAVAMGAAALVLGGAGCALLAGIEEKLPIQCELVADCAAKAPACRTATACEEGVCAPFSPVPEGTPIAEQTPGDCVQVVCDGAGNTKEILIPTDAPDDGKPCTEDTCVGRTPVHTPLKSAPCYTGKPETMGVGVCKPGTQDCDQGEPVGPCNWEVTPKDEWCNPNAAQENDDEDCDGISNEGGQNCICGDSFLSVEEGEQCDDGDTKDGDSCSANCMREWALPVTGYEHTCALLYNKSIKCWGISYLGQLGLGANDDIGDQDNEMGEKLPTVDLAGAPSVAVAAGRFHTCALTNLGEVKCWGRNDDCELGDGDLMDAQGDEPGEMGIALEYVPLANFTATAIDAGVDYSCALSNIGDVTCWGSNFYGNLGLGSDESFKCAAQSVVDLEQKAMAISAGDLHACAILVDGSVKCWGDNSSGKLGIGDTERRGDDPGEMGESLPTVHLGTSKKAIAIAAGLHHTCAILEDGSVKCWGSNMGGKLGIGYDSGFDQGDEPGEMEKLPTVNLGAGKTAVAIAAGGYHTCAILNDASVKCWGHNQWGQLGLGHTDSVGEKQDDMGDNLPTIDLGTGKKATAITAGGGHTCVQFNNGSVKCWGWGIDGILGLGDTENRGDAPGEMGDNLPTVKLFSSVW